MKRLQKIECFNLGFKVELEGNNMIGYWLLVVGSFKKKKIRWGYFANTRSFVVDFLKIQIKEELRTDETVKQGIAKQSNTPIQKSKIKGCGWIEELMSQNERGGHNNGWAIKIFEKKLWRIHRI